MEDLEAAFSVNELKSELGTGMILKKLTVWLRKVNFKF